ncbi:MAG: hypothetical protein JW830_08825 [Bacteroidales bacterium]|nr:hypothetical protein [Bacteroidales bacterium]
MPENIVVVKKNPVKLFSMDNNFFLEGQSLTVNGKLTNAQIDTSYDNLILFTKFKNSNGFKEVISYNLSSDSVIWRHRTLSQNCKIMDDKIALIHSVSSTNNNKIFLIDRKTGKPGIFTEDADVYSSSNQNVLFIFPRNGYGKELQIFNSENGLFLTRIKLPSDYFFSSYAVDDSCLYLNINGIHALNSDYEILWHADLRAMELDVKSVILSSIFSIGIGVLTGFVPIYSAPNYLANLTSNILFHNNNLFITDKENIYSFNKKSGKENWRQKLPTKTGFTHLITVNDSITAVINTGLCFKNGRMQSYGSPFYILFSNRSGNIKYSHTFITHDYVSDYEWNGDTALVVFNNGICRMNNDSIFDDQIFQTDDSLGIMQYMLQDSLNRIYISDPEKLRWHPSYTYSRSSKDVQIISTKGLIILSNDTNIPRIVQFYRIGRLLFENNSSQFFETLMHDGNKNSFRYGILKLEKLNGTIISFIPDNPYLSDKERLYILKQDSVEMYVLE